MAQEEKKKKKKAAAREDKEDSQKVSLTHLHLPPSIRPNFGFQTLYVLRFSNRFFFFCFFQSFALAAAGQYICLLH